MSLIKLSFHEDGDGEVINVAIDDDEDGAKGASLPSLLEGLGTRLVLYLMIIAGLGANLVPSSTANGDGE